MSERLSKSLVRSILRWSRQPSVKEAALSIDFAAVGFSKSLLQDAGNINHVCKSAIEVEGMTKQIYNKLRSADPAAVADAQDSAMNLLRVLNHKRKELELWYELRMKHSRPDILEHAKFRLGQVVMHMDTGTRAIVCGWQVDEESGNQLLSVIVDQLDANEYLRTGHSLLSQPNLGEGIVSSQFSLVEDPALQRVCNDSTPLYFDGFDTISGRFVANADVSYCFPLDYDSGFSSEHLLETASSEDVAGLLHPDNNNFHSSGGDKEALAMNKKLIDERFALEEARLCCIQSLANLTESLTAELDALLDGYSIPRDSEQFKGIRATNKDLPLKIKAKEDTLFAADVLDEVLARLHELKEVSRELHLLSKKDIHSDLDSLLRSDGSLDAAQAARQSLTADGTVYRAISALSACYQCVDHLLENRFQQEGRGHFERLVLGKADKNDSASTTADAEASAIEPYDGTGGKQGEIDGLRHLQPPIFRLGEVVRHKKFGYCGAIVGWDIRPLVDVSRWEGVVGLPSGADQPFYRVIPDEVDVENFLGPNTFRSSYYVAEENLSLVPFEQDDYDLMKHAPASTNANSSALEAYDSLQQTWKVKHRYIDMYFTGYDGLTGRYIAPPRLQFQFPNALFNAVTDDNDGRVVDSCSATAGEGGAGAEDVMKGLMDKKLENTMQQLEHMKDNLQREISHLSNESAFVDVTRERERRQEALQTQSLDAVATLAENKSLAGQLIAEQCLLDLHRVLKAVFADCRDGTSSSLSLDMTHLVHLLKTAKSRDDALTVENATWIVWASHRDPRVSGEMSKGVDAMKSGSTKSAFQSFKNVIKLDPTYPEAWNKIAALHHKIDQPTQCAENAERCLKLLPGHFGALAGLGMALERSGHYKEALRCLRATLDTHPWATRGPTVLQALQKKVEQEREEAVEKVLAGLDATVSSTGSVASGVIDPLGSTHDAPRSTAAATAASFRAATADAKVDNSVKRAACDADASAQKEGKKGKRKGRRSKSKAKTSDAPGLDDK